MVGARHCALIAEDEIEMQNRIASDNFRKKEVE